MTPGSKRCILPSPDRSGTGFLFLAQELRGLLSAPALWTMLIVLSLLVGYSFLQAVDLYAQASRTALNYPELAAGMDPLTGVFIPTFGAYYLSQTLLLPFLAIRLVGLDKQSGALRLLLQLPPPPLVQCGLKLAAMGLIWLLALVPGLSALLIWILLGGHVYWPPIGSLLLGHGLYGLVIVTIGMVAATLTDSLPTAAMVCLAVTLGFWVLDFAAAGQGFLARLGHWSLTGMLHRLETGLVSSGDIVSLLALALFFFLLTVTWIHPGRPLRQRMVWSLAWFLVCGLALTAGLVFPRHADLSENRVHSFRPAVTRALARLDKPLVLTVHLGPGDSRLRDMRQGILARLGRSVKRLVVRYPERKATALFADSQDDSYGLIEYSYGHRHDQSYSNSPEEMLAIIFSLAGIRVAPGAKPEYRGYPLVADPGRYWWWFYLVCPAVFLAGGLLARWWPQAVARGHVPGKTVDDSLEQRKPTNGGLS